MRLNTPNHKFGRRAEGASDEVPTGSEPCFWRADGRKRAGGRDTPTRSISEPLVPRSTPPPPRFAGLNGSSGTMIPIMSEIDGPSVGLTFSQRRSSTSATGSVPRLGSNS